MNPLLVEIPANIKGRDFVIGDLHGCYDELEKLLEFVSFDKDKDRLFSVGDLIHRGPKSSECLDLLKEKWFFSTFGNHEEIYMNNEKAEFYCEDKIKSMPYIYVVNHLIYGKFYVLHAELPPNIYIKEAFHNLTAEEIDRKKIESSIIYDYGKDIQEIINKKNFTLSESERNRIIWSREIIKFYEKKYSQDIAKGNFGFLSKEQKDDNLKIFCGHSVVPFPLRIGQQIYCDTGACFGYIGVKSKKFAKWGNQFFGLSMIDVNSGIPYICISSEHAFIAKSSNKESIYQRGDILVMEQPLYSNIFEKQ